MAVCIHDWEWRVSGTPQEIWPFLADTEGFNRFMQNPPVTYREVPDARGGSQRYGSFRFRGMAATWHELPYEWREPEGWRIRRVYQKGPLRLFDLSLTAVPDGDGTRLCIHLEITPRSPVLVPLVSLIVRDFKEKTGRFAERIQGWFEGRYERVFIEPLPDFDAVARSRMAAAGQELAALGFDGRLVEKLLGLLVTAPDGELLKIRPYALADRWQVDRDVVLRLFLHATRLGLFDMSWDLVCPACRGAKERESSLSLLKPTVHCPSCNIDFQTNFDSSVELTFRPAPAVRRVEAMLFCAGGPGNTPHIVSQRLLPAGETWDLLLPDAPGSYRLRSPQVRGQVALSVSPEGLPEAHMSLSGRESPPPELVAMPGGVIHVRNADAEPLLVVLERTQWSDQVVRASFVTSLQEFRDLFSAQVLAPGVEMGISRLAFLFSDLKSSTAMYATMGDAQAFSLVQQHFRILEREVAAHRGAVVKTIGDAIMAVFSDPGDCVTAGFAIQRAISDFNAASGGPPVIVKLGAHVGPTIAVSLNERLDYFGTTVNVAARVQNESLGQDLVVTAEMLEDAGVRLALREGSWVREGFEVHLKGLDRPYALTRFWTVKPPCEERTIPASGAGLGDAQAGSRQV